MTNFNKYGIMLLYEEEKMKKIFKVIFITMIFVLLCGIIKIDAKTIKIHDHSGGPEGGGGGVNTLTLFDSEYYIEIDDTTNIGYIVYVENGNEIILGTCEVILVDNNSHEQFICYSADNNLGTIIIEDINSNSLGTVIYVNGIVNQYVVVGNTLNLVE